MTDAPIVVAGLHKAFGRRPVLGGVDFRCGRGELVGLVGKNGAGKSTLLRALTGLVDRDQGTLTVLGLDPRHAGEAIRARTGYLPGETSVYLQMTGREFLRFALSFYPRTQADLQRDLVDLFALPLDQRVRSYSAGMKQKLALLATLVPDFELYLLDEPDRALDASVRFQLRDILLRLRAQGRTIVLSSHHLSEVESLADRLEFLMDGRFVPPATIAKARARLQRRIRLRTDGTELPPGATQLAAEPDGTRVLESAGEPLAWLQRVDPRAVRAAEIGIARLEDLYRLLLDEQRGPESAP